MPPPTSQVHLESGHFTPLQFTLTQSSDPRKKPERNPAIPTCYLNGLQKCIPDCLEGIAGPLVVPIDSTTVYQRGIYATSLAK